MANQQSGNGKPVRFLVIHDVYELREEDTALLAKIRENSNVLGADYAGLRCLQVDMFAHHLSEDYTLHLLLWNMVFRDDYADVKNRVAQTGTLVSSCNSVQELLTLVEAG